MTIAEIETLLMPQLEEMAAQVRQQFTHVKTNAHSYDVGSRTNYHGHSFYVDCVIADAEPQDPDNVALVVETSYLTTAPRINADVCWGHGQVEAEVFAESQPLTPEAFEQVLGELPRLYQALRVALSGRVPSARAV